MIIKTRKEVCELLRIDNGRLRVLFKKPGIKIPENVGTRQHPKYKIDVEILMKLLEANTILENEIVSRETLREKGSGFINHLEKGVKNNKK